MFKYLKTYLAGGAKQAIEGIRLTYANYNVAVKVVTERFGRQVILVNHHIDSFLDTEPIGSSSQTRLQHKYENTHRKTGLSAGSLCDSIDWKAVSLTLVGCAGGCCVGLKTSIIGGIQRFDLENATLTCTLRAASPIVETVVASTGSTAAHYLPSNAESLKGVDPPSFQEQSKREAAKIMKEKSNVHDIDLATDGIALFICLSAGKIRGRFLDNGFVRERKKDIPSNGITPPSGPQSSVGAEAKEREKEGGEKLKKKELRLQATPPRQNTEVFDSCRTEARERKVDSVESAAIAHAGSLRTARALRRSADRRRLDRTQVAAPAAVGASAASRRCLPDSADACMDGCVPVLLALWAYATLSVLPEDIEKLLRKGPKYACTPSVSAHDLVGLNRDLSSKANQDRERCLLDGMDCLTREGQIGSIDNECPSDEDGRDRMGQRISVPGSHEGGDAEVGLSTSRVRDDEPKSVVHWVDPHHVARCGSEVLQARCLQQGGETFGSDGEHVLRDACDGTFTLNASEEKGDRSLQSKAVDSIGDVL
ncbi:hypothetical protein HPB51_006266 [Rhipicephalus microplus]|uniref:Beta-mannosidase Ig-fold domain-containing protein n=1 Tax=Rhipicephalus microplus TaxID=6941 RepID=A0A9J6DLA5_RHIMP|nr:hypothetical protein HPB51_006266 [Rhipicephalus microplus]